MTTKTNEIEDTCNRVAELYFSVRNLTRCMSLNSNGSGRSVKVHINLIVAKQRSFRVSLSGMGLNCSPIGGILMSTISRNGNAIRCKALVGSHEDGLLTCPYECKCPDVCSNAVTYIHDKVKLSLCKIVGWNVSTAVLLWAEYIDISSMKLDYHTRWSAVFIPNLGSLKNKEMSLDIAEH